MALPPPDDRLSGWLDGELDDGTRAEVDAFLADSEQWRAELEAVRWARDRLRGLPVQEAPTGFWAEVLEESGTGPATVVPITAARSHRAWWGGAAAAVAVAAGVVGVVMMPSSAPDRVEPEVATFTDAHAVRSSIGADPITHLAPMAALMGTPGDATP
jgi:anti-sigma factor RsiW